MKQLTADERAALLARIGDRTIVASVSGGKDSAAMCLWLRELGLEAQTVRVFADTGWEHQITYDYIRGQLTEALGPIAEVRGALGMEALIRKKGMFPGQRTRFCTEELKVIPIQSFVRSVQDARGDVVNAVGIRAAESTDRAKLAEWEWFDAFDCEAWRPLLSWTEQDVIDIHARHGLAPNPLYLRGATRVGCWPCIKANKNQVRLLAEMSPERVEQISALEVEIADAMRARQVGRGEIPRTAPVTFFYRRMPGADATFVPLAEVVKWAKTDRGGRQYGLFGPAADEGCMRWNLCDSPPPETDSE